MSVCTHVRRGIPCGKPAQVIRYAIKHKNLIEVHRCTFHAALVPVGFETEEEAWASTIAELLTQEYKYDD